MAAVASSQLDQATHDQLCCTYAALILHDDGQEVTAAKINTLIDSSHNSVEKYWPILFARTLGGRDIHGLIFATSGGSAAPAATAGTPAQAAAPKDAPKKEEKKPVEEPEEVEGAMDLFGGGDDY
jgi:ribosomal protein L12E/L44/L45/RPP1/RPP2